MTDSRVTDVDALDASVVIPTFNRPDLLARALESLAAQTLPRDRFEAVVVNDSGISPSDVIDEFADVINVRLIELPKNVGLAGARNAGIDEARGRYVSFLDDDDCFYPEHLELLVGEADRLGGRTIVYSDAIRVNEDEHGNANSRSMISAPAEFSYDLLLVHNYIHVMSPLVPRRAIEQSGAFSPDLRALEDWEFWLRLGRDHPFHHVLRATADYRIRKGMNNNTTRELPRHVRCTEVVYSRHPVPPASQTEQLRTQYLQAHRAQATHTSLKVSILLAGAESFEQIVQGVQSVMHEFPRSESEIIAYVPSDVADEHGDMLHQFDKGMAGQLVLVKGERVELDAQFAVLEDKAAGLKMERRTVDGAVSATESGSESYCIRPGYVERPAPEYYEDVPSAIVWQPDVYPEAARIARVVGAGTVIDLGSGNGVKLAELHPEFEIVGVDFGANLDFVRAKYPMGTWIEANFEEPGDLPVDDAVLADSVVVCADVIEHLVSPEHLLAKLRGTFERGAAAILLSTPERALTWGGDHMGPPPNTCHVREWTLGELGALLEREGFEFGDLELTRSNDTESRLATSLAILYRDADVERRVREVRDAVTAQAS